MYDPYATGVATPKFENIFDQSNLNDCSTACLYQALGRALEFIGWVGRYPQQANLICLLVGDYSDFQMGRRVQS